MISICVDFDGTMVDHRYPSIGLPVPGAITWCKIFQEMGIDIILWTMRSDKELDDAVKYMNDNGITLYGVNDNPSQKRWTNSRKVYSPMYIDDAAIGCPLITIPGFERPCVDWNIVGMGVMDKLRKLKKV